MCFLMLYNPAITSNQVNYYFNHIYVYQHQKNNGSGLHRRTDAHNGKPSARGNSHVEHDSLFKQLFIEFFFCEPLVADSFSECGITFSCSKLASNHGRKRTSFARPV